MTATQPDCPKHRGTRTYWNESHWVCEKCDHELYEASAWRPSMPKYRKKPIVIEAVHYEGAGDFEDHIVPTWLWEALEDGTISPSADGVSLVVQTLEGPLAASPGDWIIRGVQSEFYPCKPDIFEATYDPIPCPYCAGSGWTGSRQAGENHYHCGCDRPCAACAPKAVTDAT